MDTLTKQEEETLNVIALKMWQDLKQGSFTYHTKAGVEVKFTLEDK